MSDVSAPASTPVAPSAPTGGASVSPAPASHVPPAAGEGLPTSTSDRARANDGRFLSKEGSAGIVKPDAPPGENATEAQKEAYRLKRELKVFGKTEAVDLDEDGIVRELQIKRALEKRVGDYQKGHQRAQKLIELATQDPESFLRELGHDPEAIARKRLAKQAQLGAMSPEERELLELREYRQTTETQAQQRAEAEKKAKVQAQTERLTQENERTFMAALEKADLPKSHETLYYMVETAQIGLKDGIEYTPDELAKETAKRLDTLTSRYLGNLSGAALAKRLGPQLVQSLIAAEVAKFEASQNFQQPEVAEEVEPDDGEEFISPAQLNERLRNMRSGR